MANGGSLTTPDHTLPPGLRLSCTSCKERKQRCDRNRPQCSRCEQIGQHCNYPTKRQKNTGKRAQVRALEVKLAELEGRINGAHAEALDPSRPGQPLQPALTAHVQTPQSTSWPPRLGDYPRRQVPQHLPQKDSALPVNLDPCSPCISEIEADNVTVSPSIAGELTAAFFSKAYQATPMIHRERYLNSLDASPINRPRLCLQYAIMATGARVSPSHKPLVHELYIKARRLAESDETKHSDHKTLVLAHAQAWLLIANIEAQDAMFSGAFISLGKAIRIAQVLHLHDMVETDDALFIRPILDAPRDWIEAEERRRTWWAIHASDRLVFAVAGLPTAIDEEQVQTLLPVSEGSFQAGVEEPTVSLRDALQTKDHMPSSQLAMRVLAASLLYRAMDLGRKRNTNSRDAAGESRVSAAHQKLERDIANVMAQLPEALRLPRNFRCQQTIFVNVLIQAASLCLHKAMIAEERSAQSAEADFNIKHSQGRALNAAIQIADIFQLVEDIHTALQNPVQTFGAYIAARVLLEDLALWNNPHSRQQFEFLYSILCRAGSDHIIAQSLSTQLQCQGQDLGVHLSYAAGAETPALADIALQ